MGKEWIAFSELTLFNVQHKRPLVPMNFSCQPRQLALLGLRTPTFRAMSQWALAGPAVLYIIPHPELETFGNNTYFSCIDASLVNGLAAIQTLYATPPDTLTRFQYFKVIFLSISSITYLGYSLNEKEIVGYNLKLLNNHFSKTSVFMKTKIEQCLTDVSPPFGIFTAKPTKIIIMKKMILFFIITLSICKFAKSQITKGTWLLSGSANFSMIKYNSEGTLNYKQTNLSISPSIGYFLKDKFALGIRPSLTYGSSSISSGNSETIFSVGPFVRYYFLKTDKVFNILTDGSYSYTSFGSSGVKQSTISLAAGPVVYFNPSVGLEFLIGYASTKVAKYSGRNNELRFSIGFQFNLEKEK